MKEITYIVKAVRSESMPRTGTRPTRPGVTLPVDRWLFISPEKGLLPDAHIYAAVHNARELPKNVPDYQIPHINPHLEIYLALGNKPDLTGLRGQIKLEGRVFKFKSPCTIVLPAGLNHEHKLTGGSGKFVVLLASPKFAHVPQEPRSDVSEQEYTRLGGLIIPAEARPASTELLHHLSTEPGTRFVFVDKNKGHDWYTIFRRVENVKPDQAHYVKTHAHNCDSYHLFIGNNDDLTGLKAEVEINGKTQIVESPAAVFIPPKTPHKYRVIEGSGVFGNILPKGDYNRTLLPSPKSHGQETNKGRA